jgi:hypothetical protein
MKMNMKWMLVTLVGYAFFMVVSVLLYISGRKQKKETINALKSQLQTQDPVVGVVISLTFERELNTQTKMVRARVEYGAEQYYASVPPGTKVGDQVQILLHSAYAIHSSFRDDPLHALSFAGNSNPGSNKRESLTPMFMFLGTLSFAACICIIAAIANYNPLVNVSETSARQQVKRK